MFANQLEHPRGSAALRIEHDGGARLQRKVGGERERIGMEAGAAADDDVAGPQTDEGRRVQPLAVQHVPVPVHGPLRRPGAAGGVEPEGDVVA